MPMLTLPQIVRIPPRVANSSMRAVMREQQLGIYTCTIDHRPQSRATAE